MLPESLPLSKRRPYDWRRANPFSSLLGLSRLEGVGPLVAVIALASLAQFAMHTSWVLYTTFKFGWGPAQNGWSLFTVGLMSVFVQGFLLKHLLKRFAPHKLAVMGLTASSLTYLGFGLVHTMDMGLAALAVEAGQWQPQALDFAQMPARFAYQLKPVPNALPAPPRTPKPD